MTEKKRPHSALDDSDDHNQDDQDDNISINGNNDHKSLAQKRKEKRMRRKEREKAEETPQESSKELKESSPKKSQGNDDLDDDNRDHDHGDDESVNLAQDSPQAARSVAQKRKEKKMRKKEREREHPREATNTKLTEVVEDDGVEEFSFQKDEELSFEKVDDEDSVDFVRDSSVIQRSVAQKRKEKRLRRKERDQKDQEDQAVFPEVNSDQDNSDDDLEDDLMDTSSVTSEKTTLAQKRKEKRMRRKERERGSSATPAPEGPELALAVQPLRSEAQKRKEKRQRKQERASALKQSDKDQGLDSGGFFGEDFDVGVEVQKAPKSRSATHPKSRSAQPPLTAEERKQRNLEQRRKAKQEKRREKLVMRRERDKALAEQRRLFLHFNKNSYVKFGTEGATPAEVLALRASRSGGVPDIDDILPVDEQDKVKGVYSQKESDTIAAVIDDFLKERSMSPDEFVVLLTLPRDERRETVKDLMSKLCEFVPTRSRLSMYCHITRTYHGHRRSDAWTREEDSQLSRYVLEMGHNWLGISNLLRRSPLVCKDRYRIITAIPMPGKGEWLPREELLWPKKKILELLQTMENVETDDLQSIPWADVCRNLKMYPPFAKIYFKRFQDVAFEDGPPPKKLSAIITGIRQWVESSTIPTTMSDFIEDDDDDEKTTATVPEPGLDGEESELNDSELEKDYLRGEESSEEDDSEEDEGESHNSEDDDN